MEEDLNMNGISFYDLVTTAPYGLLSFLAVDECRKLRATCKDIRFLISRSMQDFCCRYRGRLRWISGHERSFLNGPIDRAKYNGILDMSCTSSGTVVVSDSNNGVIRGLRHGTSDVLTIRNMFSYALHCKDEDVYLACYDGIYYFSLGPHRSNVIRHRPTLLFAFEYPSRFPNLPTGICINEKANVFFTTYGSSRLCINNVSKDVKGSTLHGICAFQRGETPGALVCDTQNNQILFVDAQGNASFLLTIPTPRCIERLGTTLFVSSDTILYEIRNFESKPDILLHDLDFDLPLNGPSITSLTTTPDGTLLVGTQTQIFSFL
jgi:hypothetical protein